MVNSESLESDGDGRKTKDVFTQRKDTNSGPTTQSNIATSAVSPRDADFSSRTADASPLSQAIEPTATKTEFNSTISCNLQQYDTTANLKDTFTTNCGRSTMFDETFDNKTSLYCSLPLNKIQDVLSTNKTEDETKKNKLSKKLLCLYCERTFVTPNLKLKHVDRCHSVKQERRCSSRFQNQQSTTACSFCNTLNNTNHSLNDLFQHLVNNHPTKYFGCIPCEERFSNLTLLQEHKSVLHGDDNEVILTKKIYEKTKLKNNKSKIKDEQQQQQQQQQVSIKTKVQNKKIQSKQLQNNKKVGVKSVKLGVRRTTRLQTKILEMSSKNIKKRPKSKLKSEQTTSTSGKKEERPQPRPTFNFSFDNIFTTYKKITDHSIDNLRISTLTFDDVFDKAFFNKINCNIQENLLNHLDGKLFKNEESESRISNFEKTNPQIDFQPGNSDNYGCEISLNAATPIPSTSSATTQLGDDFESQIEYGSKASKKKNVIKKDEVHYKYFTRRKYQATLLENKENRDLSKLDMWTQLIIKKRQQDIINETKTEKEKLEYTKCDEYKSKMQREELNRILDKRGPFEDLKIEASKMAALDKTNTTSDVEIFTEVRDVLNDLLDKVLLLNSETLVKIEPSSVYHDDEIPSFLNLRKKSSITNEQIIDQSDKITLICSSQETENFEVSNSIPRKNDELVELTGEWARSRIYICAACGCKVNSAKSLIDHKNIFHQYVWCQHYEFVGNQSELYRHLSIPGLGKIGYVEEHFPSKFWTRSNARECSKCSKQCNTLGELHRHILECGEDWSWMLARKKCKYRPFGSRRKRRGLVKRIIHKDTKPEMQEKKKIIKKMDGPRTKPSDAETIQRMLANLPAKRATRKIMCLKDGFQRNTSPRKNAKNSKPKEEKNKSANKTNTKKYQTNKSKMSLRQRNKAALAESTINEEDKVKRKNGQKCNPILRKSFRNINKVLSSKILDTTSRLKVKRKLKDAIMETQKNSKNEQIILENVENEESVKNNVEDTDRPKYLKRKQQEQDNNISIKESTTNNTKNLNKLKRKVSLDDKCSELMKTQIENNDTATKSKNKLKTLLKFNKNTKVDKIKKDGSLVNTLKRTFTLRKTKEKKNDKEKVNEDILKLDDEISARNDLKRKYRNSLRNVVKKIKLIKTEKNAETLHKKVDGDFLGLNEDLIVKDKESLPEPEKENVAELEKQNVPEQEQNVPELEQNVPEVEQNVSKLEKQNVSEPEKENVSKPEKQNVSKLEEQDISKPKQNVSKPEKQNVPKLEKQNVPEAGKQNVPEAEIQNVPEAEIQNVRKPEIQNVPEAEKPEIQNVPKPEKQNVSKPEKQNVPKLEKENVPAPDKKNVTDEIKETDDASEQPKLNFENNFSISRLTKAQENILLSVIKNTKEILPQNQEFDKKNDLSMINETWLQEPEVIYKKFNQYFPFTFGCVFKDNTENYKLNFPETEKHVCQNKDVEKVQNENIIIPVIESSKIIKEKHDVENKNTSDVNLKNDDKKDEENTKETVIENNTGVVNKPQEVKVTKKSTKRSRGLNDCIAMLTSKLQDKKMPTVEIKQVEESQLSSTESNIKPDLKSTSIEEINTGKADSAVDAKHLETIVANAIKKAAAEALENKKAEMMKNSEAEKIITLDKPILKIPEITPKSFTFQKANSFENGKDIFNKTPIIANVDEIVNYDTQMTPENNDTVKLRENPNENKNGENKNPTEFKEIFNEITPKIALINNKEILKMTTPLQTFINQNVLTDLTPLNETHNKIEDNEIFNNINITKEKDQQKPENELDLCNNEEVDDKIQLETKMLVDQDVQIENEEIAKENIEIKTNLIETNAFKTTVEDVMKPLENMNKNDDIKCIKLIIKKKISQNENKNWARKNKPKIGTHRKRMNTRTTQKNNQPTEMESVNILENAFIENKMSPKNENEKPTRKIGQKRKTQNKKSFVTEDLPYLETNLDDVILPEEPQQQFDDKLDMNLSNNDSGVFVDEKIDAIPNNDTSVKVTRKKKKHKNKLNEVNLEKVIFLPIPEQLETEILENKCIESLSNKIQTQTSDSEDEIPLAFIKNLEKSSVTNNKNQEDIPPKEDIKPEVTVKKRGRKKKRTNPPIDNNEEVKNFNQITPNLDLIFDELKNKESIDSITPAKLPETQSETHLNSYTDKTPTTEESDYFEPLADINTLDSYSSTDDDESNVEFVKEPVITEHSGDLKICIKLKESIKKKGRNKRKFDFNPEISPTEVYEENATESVNKTSEIDDKNEANDTIDEEILETEDILNNMSCSSDNNIHDKVAIDAVEDIYNDLTRTEVKKRGENKKYEDEIVEDENDAQEEVDDVKETSEINLENDSKEKNLKVKKRNATKDLETLKSTTKKLLAKRKTPPKPEELQDENTYCEICNKTFVRAENLIKHKRTLTHIAKLSEIEAKEDAERKKLLNDENEVAEVQPEFEEAPEAEIETKLPEKEDEIIDDSSSSNKMDINISNILQKPNEMLILSPKNVLVPPALTSNDTLKLADIINDVLNKPVNSENETLLKTNNFNENIEMPAKRYKSLGERKSFEEESATNVPYKNYSELIAQKQISLLENIIEENHVNYNEFGEENSNASNLKQDEILKNDDDNNFMKPVTQYEEISEDSLNLRNNIEEQTTRKALNRDEELFLECCSLLKSSSEVSNYSKKSTKTIPVFENFKPIDEPEWLERKSVKPDYEKDCNDIYSETSDLNDYSNSYSSNDWHNSKNSNSEPIFEDISLDSKDSSKKDETNLYLNNFKTAFKTQIIHDCDDEREIETHKAVVDVEKENKTKLVSRFGGLMVNAFKNKFQIPAKKTKRQKSTEVVQKAITEYLENDNVEESSNELSTDNKKMLTKGAMKIFEGLKVSIPTDDLDMTEVLNCSPKTQIKTTETDKKIKSNKGTLKKFGNKLGLKVTKKKHLQNKRSPKSKNSDKILDIYDFEETQDNTDVFTTNITDLKTFRNQTKSIAGIEEQQEKKSDQQEVQDSSFNYEVESLSSFSTESSYTLKKSKPKNMTKKKCMIMGRIFKNAFKSKCDDPIQEIPTLDHSKLVENYVLNCPTLPDDKKPPAKISDVEMDILFDRLLEEEVPNPPLLEPPQNNDVKKLNKSSKQKGPRNRKRRNDDASDDEFNINKGPKKRNTKKNNKIDVGINLEQELKECIGVASRKSQRKCTSGKQNVLVEYWSSDESNFENFLEEIASANTPIFNNNPVVTTDDVIPIPIITEEMKPDEISETALNDEDKSASNVDFNKQRKQKRRKLNAKPMKIKEKQDKQFKKHLPKEFSADSLVATRKKRNASDTLYYWSSSSDDEFEDLIEVKPIREEDDDEDRPMQHGWIVGDSPKKLVTMLAQAKGKKTETECVKEQGKKRTTV